MTNENKSLTDIVNSALAQIGDTPIHDISDENDGRAKMARLLIRQVIREVQVHPSACWEELMDEERLTLRGKSEHAVPATEFVYNAPLNLLSIFGVYDYRGLKMDYRYFGGHIRTHKPARYIRFVRHTENPDAWSPELKSCVISLLSAKLVGAILKDVSGSRQLTEMFWHSEFKRFAGNRILNSHRSRSGRDDDYRRFYDDAEDDDYRGLNDARML